MNTPFTLVTAAAFAAATLLVACEKKSAAPAPAKPAANTPAAASHDHDHADHDHHDDHDHGPTTELGTQEVAGFTVKASRDGEIKSAGGGDVPIDVWVTPLPATAAKVAAVRFWIGAEDAKGSVKAKAEIEKDNWHTHAEVPEPLPPASKLWVEIETDAGAKHTVGFDLKM